MSEAVNAILSAIVGAIAFGGFAFCWIEARRADELDRRYKREIERATRHAETNPIVGRREA